MEGLWKTFHQGAADAHNDTDQGAAHACGGADNRRLATGLLTKKPRFERSGVFAFTLEKIILRLESRSNKERKSKFLALHLELKLEPKSL